MRDPIILSAFSDLLINLSSGWFGAALIIPIMVVKGKGKRIWALFFNIALGIVALILGIMLREFRMKEYTQKKVHFIQVLSHEDAKIAIAFGIIVILFMLLYIAWIK